MPYLLNVCYFFVLLAALPWLWIRAIRQGKYREGYAAKFLGWVPRRTSRQKCIWFHAVSVGEVNLLAPLLKQIGRRRPDWECVLSTTTMTGMALAQKKYVGLTIFYCPLDFSWAVRTAMKRIRPDVLVLAELELWPNLVWAARERGTRVAVINGRLSERSYRGYRRIRGLGTSILGQIDLLAVQDETYAGRFTGLGGRPHTVHVTGSMKYDGAHTDRSNPATQRLARLAGFAPDDVVFLAGSTQEPEEETVLEVFSRLAKDWPKLRLVIVPRHPERFEAVARLLDASGIAWQRRTALNDTAPRPEAEPRVLLVDVVGELGAWWGTAEIAFVGGSFGDRGGQNMIEPAAYGAAVAFGPNTWNFRDIVTALLAHKAAVVVADGKELGDFVGRCLADPGYAQALGQRAQGMVFQQTGATEKTFQLLAPLVDQRTAEAGENRRTAA